MCWLTLYLHLCILAYLLSLMTTGSKMPHILNVNTLAKWRSVTTTRLSLPTLSPHLHPWQSPIFHTFAHTIFNLCHQIGKMVSFWDSKVFGGINLLYFQKPLSFDILTWRISLLRTYLWFPCISETLLDFKRDENVKICWVLCFSSHSKSL